MKKVISVLPIISLLIAIVNLSILFDVYNNVNTIKNKGDNRIRGQIEIKKINVDKDYIFNN